MPLATPAPPGDAALRSKDWPLRANRWVQLTFAEDDPAHFDAEFWHRLMRESRANAVCVSAGGYIAYYPTRIPFHYRSSFLGDTDLFGTVVAGARALDMHVMARVDPHAVHADAAAAHPEWLARDPNGAPLAHWSFPGIWLTCPFSPYHREFITEVARELVRDYDIDAIFANRWEGHGGISYSEPARRAFRDDTGFDRAAFAAMKPSAYFVCISRGGIVDDDALLDALRRGEIAGAGLDAHGVEPLPAESAFWRLPQVIVTPHNGATTAATAQRGRAIVAENLRRFVRGQPLLNVVDKAAGY